MLLWKETVRAGNLASANETRKEMDNRYDVLFQQVPIGPVVTPNRFYQVPHCNGFGYRMPKAPAAMRGIKAEGGWEVVCMEDVEIHHRSDLMPYVEGR